MTAITLGWANVNPICKPGVQGISDGNGTVFIYYSAANCPPTTGLCSASSSGNSCLYGCLFCADGLVHGVNATSGTFIGLAKAATTGAFCAA